MSTNYHIYNPSTSDIDQFWIDIYNRNIEIILCIKSNEFQLPPIFSNNDAFHNNENVISNTYVDIVDHEHNVIKLGSKRYKLKNDSKQSVVNSNTFHLISYENKIYRINNNIIDENNNNNEFLIKELCIVSIDWIWNDSIDIEKNTIQLPDIAQMRLRVILPLYQIFYTISSKWYSNSNGVTNNNNTLLPVLPIHMCIYSNSIHDYIICSILLCIDMTTRLNILASDLNNNNNNNNNVNMDDNMNIIQINIINNNRKEKQMTINSSTTSNCKEHLLRINTNTIPIGMDTVFALLYPQNVSNMNPSIHIENPDFHGFLSINNLTIPYSINKESITGDSQSVSMALAQYILRVSNACLKAYHGFRGIINGIGIGIGTTNLAADQSIPIVNEIKPLPIAGEKDGYSVLEFFSGIGGMRLSLPPVINDIPITSVCAYDISSVANEVYTYNFHHDRSFKLDVKGGKLYPKLIDGLKLTDVENKAHIWTMSPPCQPYTTTKGALQLDQNDNRSKGLYHLMYLLRHMRYKPNWIVLENVASFQPSEGCVEWKKCLVECGYSFKECLLSPHSCGLEIPNSRLRYYMLIQHNTTIKSENNSNPECFNTMDNECMKVLPPHIIEYYKSTIPAPDITSTDNNINNNMIDSSQIGYYVKEHNPSVLESLYIPLDIMQSHWLPRIVSVASHYDTISHCFTKSYGSRRNKFDKSCGSCFYMHGCGPMRSVTNGVHHNDNSSIIERLARIRNKSSSTPNLSSSINITTSSSTNNNTNAISISSTDTSNKNDTLESYYGEIRLFHPEEMLKLSGFPNEFIFPDSIHMNKQYSCIGNSINVSVVKCIMMYLFEKK